MLTRQRDFIQWLFGVMLTVVLTLGVAWLFEAQTPGTEANRQKEAILRGETPLRMPASVDGKTGPNKISKGKQGKGSSNIAITIESVGSSPEGVLTLKAEVLAQSDLTNLKYQWVLPENVSVTTGSNEGELGDLGAGQTKELETTFLIPPTENKQIHLQVYSVTDGERLGEVAQFNTLRQPEIDRSIASKQEILESAVAEGIQKPKIMH